MTRFGSFILAGLFVAGAALAAPRQPPSVADWIAMTPQQRMALREESRSWQPEDRTAFWARFEDELKTMSPAQRQALADQAAAQMRALTPTPSPDAAPVQKLPKAIALPPPGDLTNQPD